MNAKHVLDELSSKMASASGKSALVGLDGFVDKIIRPVGNRFGQGKDFDPIPTIEQFGRRILDAVGTSANIELYEDYEKLGGNGPIMADALVSAGLQVRYIGALGQPLEDVFKAFAERTKAVSICPPGITHAVEFEDGKIMFGSMKGLDDVTLDRVLEAVGEGAFLDMVNRADLISLVNWTMIPNMTAFLEGMLTKILPNLGPKESGRSFYFDLADPAKRSKGDLKEVLNVISRYRSHGAVTLGLNFSEARQVAGVLEAGDAEDSPDGLKAAATRIRSALNLTCVVIHPRAGAACATRDGAWYVDGPLCKAPKISTGAGDHFNAGFAASEVIGLSPESRLAVAVATSGQYVRTGRSPSLRETARFIENWTSGNLSD